MSNVTYAQVLTIGREADISLPDTEETVSRKHCEIIILDGGYYIKDLGSQNGTFLEMGGRLSPISQAWVNLHDTIVLGETRTSLAEILGDSQHAIPGGVSPGSDANYVERPGVAPVKEERSYKHVSGKRIRCPNGHITMSNLQVCHRCGETL